MWDSQSLIDQAAVDYITSIGGLKAIVRTLHSSPIILHRSFILPYSSSCTPPIPQVISHPHFYDSCIEWSQTLGDVPIYISAQDKEWVMRPDPDHITLWEGDELRLLEGEVTVVRCGGHFDGSCVLIWHRGEL